MLDLSLECPGCGASTLLENFGFVQGKDKYYHNLCRSCAKAKRRNSQNESARKGYQERYQKLKNSESRLAHRHKMQRKSLLKKFGITSEEYDEMLSAQNGVCACCGNPETVVGHRSTLPRLLAVDHDHQTGKVRALLCGNCNTSLGRMGESPERIEKLLQYAKWCEEVRAKEIA